ncbi:acyltransferase family protein [Mumia sp. DW29H23]|uniref:acyltransferase family protein n=1 Tax=Mumia sp. DW29H23 TaxID=3421241 RepID=UPI003D692C3E
MSSRSLVERSPRARDERAASGTRADIQALRAVAVSLVLIYHLWPNRLTGGFTGVDVFFVISGFLITSHLLGKPPRSGRDLAGFWSRRIRRLLPASLLVLAVTLVASRLVAPETQWAATAKQAGAAALYVVNWVLASDAVDYLAAENSPTPVQHFWSLSVEEQFYIGWPLLILVLVTLSARVRRSPTTVVAAGLGAVVVASFAYSIHETVTEPARAYFVTPTRVWELGVGGLLAVLIGRHGYGRGRAVEAVAWSPAARAVLAWIGLLAIVWTGFTYTGATPFPGWQAAVPVLGAAAVIAANAPTAPGSPAAVMATRPVQWLGDVSYSVYLWHWPLIVLLPYATGSDLGLLDKLAILAASLVLAALTKHYVEDPFRSPRWGRPLLKPYALGVVGMAVVVAMAAVQLAEVDRKETAARAALASALADDDPCFGAAALAPGADCPRTTDGQVVPAPAQALKDKSDAYEEVSGGKDCWASAPRFPVTVCEFGDPDAKTSIALTGNSHAGQWLPALQEIARTRGWRITTYLASQCGMAETRQQFDTTDKSARCSAWVERVTRRIASGGFDMVVYTNRISVPAVGKDIAGSQDDYRRGYEKVLSKVRAAGVPVMVIRDTPAPGTIIPDCLAANAADLTRCSAPRRDWEPSEPVVDAVHDLDDRGIVLADLNDRICRPDRCDGAVGGVVVYFDGSHLTATYARTLAPALERPLTRALARG